MAMGDYTPDQLVATPIVRRGGRAISASSVRSAGSYISWGNTRLSVVTSSSGHLHRLHAASSKTKECLLWTLGMFFFWISQVALPLLLLCQMFALNVILVFSYGVESWSWLWIFVVAEVLLIVHLSLNRQPNRAATCGTLQWIVYCWIISAHSGLLFFSVLPRLNSEVAEVTGEGRRREALEFLLQSRTIITILWISPVFYTVLAFRSLRQLTGTDLLRNARRQVSLRQKYATLDVALLLDMLWHVVIDFIDIIAMMFALSLKEHQGLSEEMLPVVERIRATTGVFIVLALFYHQQSYPSIGYLGASRSDTGQGTGMEHTPDVVKARKRSAVVSIILVDLPFMAIRTYAYALEISLSDPKVSDELAESSTLASGVAAGAQLDKWWVKNILCLLLQAMQLRFVQHAEQERSQSIRWWDQNRNALQRSRDQTKRHLGHDQSLAQAWKDELGADAASLDSPANPLERLLPPPSEGSGGASATPASGAATPDADQGGISDGVDAGAENSGSSDEDLDAPSQRQPSRRRRCLWCCCSCGCSTCRWLLSSSAVLSHALMGLVLGWLIAKIDFAQLLNELVATQHAATMSKMS